VIVYILRRSGDAVPTVFISTVLVFLLLRLLPGDPAVVLAGGQATPEAVESIRQSMGLNEPLPVQYAMWLGQVARGDLGKSIFTQIPVSTLLGQRIPATLTLAVIGFFLSTTLALILGLIAALKQRSPVDWFISGFAGASLSIPNFWLGILMILVFSVTLGWLPPGGRGDFSSDAGHALKSIIMPAIALSLPGAMALSRLVKATMLEVLYEDYVRTARAKGVSPHSVVVRHALRNALIPLVTALGIESGRLVGGAVIIEAVFGWAGIGSLMLTAISSRDYTVVQSSLLILVMFIILVNLLVDISYGFIDPRVRAAQSGAR
jgi:peptide/nickel transport system permease protein